MCAAWNPEELRVVLPRLKEAGLVREWRETPDGYFRVKWNEDFRDGFGGEHALQILHHILMAIGTFPPLTWTQVRVMADLGAPREEPDE